MLHYKSRRSQHGRPIIVRARTRILAIRTVTLAGGQKYKRVGEESIKCVGQIIQSKPNRSFDLIAQPENATNFRGRARRACPTATERSGTADCFPSPGDIVFPAFGHENHRSRARANP